MGGDHRHVLVAVAGQGGAEDRIPFVPREIHIEVRRVGARRRQKAFEQQPIAQGIDVGDAQAVDHQGRGPAAPAAGPAARRQVGHRQQVAREPLGGDHPQFVDQAPGHGFRQGVPVAPPKPRLGPGGEGRLGVFVVGGWHVQGRGWHAAAARRQQFMTGKHQAGVVGEGRGQVVEFLQGQGRRGRIGG